MSLDLFLVQAFRSFQSPNLEATGLTSKEDSLLVMGSASLWRSGVLGTPWLPVDLPVGM